MSRAFLFRLASMGLMLSLHYALSFCADLFDDIERARLDVDALDVDDLDVDDLGVDVDDLDVDARNWIEDADRALATVDTGPPVPDAAPCKCAQLRAARAAGQHEAAQE